MAVRFGVNRFACIHAWRMFNSFHIRPEARSNNPDNKVHGANMGPIWGLQDSDGPHDGPMNFAIWEAIHFLKSTDYNFE